MDKDTASEVVGHLKVCIEQLNLALIHVQRRASTTEFEQFRRGTATVLVRIYDDLLNDIYVEHLDLAPEELRGILEKR